MFVSLTVLMISGIAYVVYGYVAMRNGIVRDSQTQARIVGNNCRAALTFGDTPDAEDTLSSFKENPSVILARLFNQEGEVVGLYENDGVSSDLTIIPCEANEHILRHGRLALSQAIQLNGTAVGHLYVLCSLDQVTAVARQNIAVVVGLTLILSAAAYFISAILERGISGPILKLAKTTQDIITSQCYSRCEIEHGEDELGLLIDSFNSMINDLKQRTTSVKHLNAINQTLESEIAERTEAQEKLQIFRRFAEESSNGVGLVDIQGNLTFVNPALCHILGEAQPEDTSGKPVTRYYDEETQRRLAEEVFPDTIAKGRWTGELNVTRKNGDIVPTHNSLFSICNAEGDST